VTKEKERRDIEKREKAGRKREIKDREKRKEEFQVRLRNPVKWNRYLIPREL
jgi:hypothetical protein